MGFLPKSTRLEKLLLQLRATEGICRAPPESFDLIVGTRKNLNALLPWMGSWAGTPGEQRNLLPCEKSNRYYQFWLRDMLSSIESALVPIP
jgi:hypothetical protein